MRSFCLFREGLLLLGPDANIQHAAGKTNTVVITHSAVSLLETSGDVDEKVFVLCSFWSQIACDRKTKGNYGFYHPMVRLPETSECDHLGYQLSSHTMSNKIKKKNAVRYAMSPSNLS